MFKKGNDRKPNKMCVQPILCSVKLNEGQKFDPNFKDAYKYFTLGGNSSHAQTFSSITSLFKIFVQLLHVSGSHISTIRAAP